MVLSDPKPERPRNKMVPEGAVVEKFAMRELTGTSLPSYRKIRATFDREKLQPRDERFMLSQHVQNQLSVEEEEERRFRKRVEEEVGQLKTETEKQARAEGYAAGEKSGRSDAYAQEKARIASLLEGLAASTQSLVYAKTQLSNQYERAVIDLAYRMASVVVNHEIEHRPEQVAEAIKEILERISRDDDVRIRLANREFGAIKEIEAELANVNRAGRVHFEMDATLSSGDCIVESVSGEISSVIEEKLSRLKEEINRIYPDAIKKKTGT
jgi:flagellar assembly protein FliH